MRLFVEDVCKKQDYWEGLELERLSLESTLLSRDSSFFGEGLRDSCLSVGLGLSFRSVEVDFCSG